MRQPLQPIGLAQEPGGEVKDVLSRATGAEDDGNEFFVLERARTETAQSLARQVILVYRVVERSGRRGGSWQCQGTLRS